jgi:hypothetical protein
MSHGQVFGDIPFFSIDMHPYYVSILDTKQLDDREDDTLELVDDTWTISQGTDPSGDFCTWCGLTDNDREEKLTLIWNESQWHVRDRTLDVKHWTNLALHLQSLSMVCLAEKKKYLDRQETLAHERIRERDRLHGKVFEKLPHFLISLHPDAKTDPDSKPRVSNDTWIVSQGMDLAGHFCTWCRLVKDPDRMHTLAWNESTQQWFVRDSHMLVKYWESLSQYLESLCRACEKK